MISMLRTVKHSDLFRNNLIFFVGSTAVGALNYFLYPVVSRFLSVTQFGEVQVLINVLVQLTVLTNVVSLFVVNIVTNMKQMTRIRQFITSIEVIATIASLLAALLIAAFAPMLAKALQYNSFIPFLAIVVIIIINVPLSIRIGFLRARRAFAHTSYSQILQSSLRLGLATAAAALGLGVAGIMFGLAGSLLLSIAYVTVVSNRLGLNSMPFASLGYLKIGMNARHFLGDHVLSLRGTGRYMILVTAATFSVMFLLSIDTILAKYYFSPEDAGLYGGLSVVARILFFGTASVAGVLASSVTIADKRQRNLLRLLGSATLALVGGGVLVAVFRLYPEQAVRLLVGSQYTSYAAVLPTLATAVFCISLINLLTTYHVAMRDMYITFIAPVSAAIVCGMMIVSSGDISQYAQGFARGTTIALLMMVIWSIYWHLFRAQTTANPSSSATTLGSALKKARGPRGSQDAP